MDRSAWIDRVDRYRQQGRDQTEIREIAAYLQQRGPRTKEAALARAQEIDIVSRPLFVDREREEPHLRRDAGGHLALRLVDAGDRLVIWSPLDDGALINPKSPNLRRAGLISTYVRGASFNAAAFRAADLSPGSAVELVRDPENEHDKNAVQLRSPRDRRSFGFVQKGRAAGIARRLDAGEQLAAVSMRGPGVGDASGSALLLVGSSGDLARALDAPEPGVT